MSIQSHAIVQVLCSYLGDWPPVTAIPAADLPHCSLCVYIIRKSAELRTENTGIDGMDLQNVYPEFYSNEEQLPRKVFLRGISPLKILPPEEDGWRLVAYNPCGCQVGGGVAAWVYDSIIFSGVQVGVGTSTVL